MAEPFISQSMLGDSIKIVVVTFHWGHPQQGQKNIYGQEKFAVLYQYFTMPQKECKLGINCGCCVIFRTMTLLVSFEKR